MAEKDFMGIGMHFPPEIDKASGRFKTSAYEDKIKESILLILKTQRGERLTLPQFGGSINNYVFTNTDTTTLNLMANSIKKVLTKNEKRIKDVKIRILQDKTESGRLNVDINYLVTQSDIPGNLVFPFYLEGVEDKDNEDE